MVRGCSSGRGRGPFNHLKSYEVWLDPAIVEKYPPCYFTGGQRVGDESNLNPKFATDKSLWIPASYAYAAGFFHEGSGGGGKERPRKISEVKDPAGTLFVLNSRMGYPDLGPWTMEWKQTIKGENTSGTSKYGPFISHQGRLVFMMVDGHVTTMKLRDTVVPVDLWKHRDYPYSQILGWVNNMAAEYK